MKMALATLLILLLASQQASRPAATVASAAGSWKAAGGALTRGKALTVGEMLTATAPGGLLLDCPNELVAYSCRGNDCSAQACEQKSIGLVRRTVIRSKEQAPAARGWMDALIRREPREPIARRGTRWWKSSRRRAARRGARRSVGTGPDAGSWRAGTAFD
jgi:hypothetical protein